ncbi:hypothetical protein BN2497_11323 [Janthinobacterium sp. CG23_2]|nr:hypothetical protein BN2497_11323 [Janthinobacterium sp. CG23_2]CUU32059.1 hypothetical protein BN3177_11323 [Janthinobacterium sp. CG23_2]
MMLWVNIRAFTFVFHLTRFPIYAQMATGFEKSRVAFSQSVRNLAIPTQKRLTWIFFQPTMRLSTCTYVLVDKK